MKKFIPVFVLAAVLWPAAFVHAQDDDAEFY